MPSESQSPRGPAMGSPCSPSPVAREFDDTRPRSAAPVHSAGSDAFGLRTAPPSNHQLFCEIKQGPHEPP